MAPPTLLSSVFSSSSSVRVLFRAEFDTAVYCEGRKDVLPPTSLPPPSSARSPPPPPLLSSVFYSSSSVRVLFRAEFI